jgi:hypothetical protein
MQMADERIIAWPSRQLMWDISDVEKGLPDGCAVYVREDVANAVWDQAVEACMQVIPLTIFSNREDCDQVFKDLRSLKRSGKDNG